MGRTGKHRVAHRKRVEKRERSQCSVMGEGGGGKEGCYRKEGGIGTREERGKG